MVLFNPLKEEPVGIVLQRILSTWLTSLPVSSISGFPLETAKSLLVCNGAAVDPSGVSLSARSVSNGVVGNRSF